MSEEAKPLVGVIMGSHSDWAVMEHCTKQLAELGVSFEAKVISAHRTPDLLQRWVAASGENGMEVIIAAAGGAAHLAGVTAAMTPLPVLGVPMKAWSTEGLDSLLSMVQMPGGVPVGTLAVGKPGAKNAALLATAILGNKYPEYRQAYEDFRAKQTAEGEANQDLPAS
jgi:5-(carboxyamino)imidazole ribonucleotide mutase